MKITLALLVRASLQRDLHCTIHINPSESFNKYVNVAACKSCSFDKNRSIQPSLLNRSLRQNFERQTLLPSTLPKHLWLVFHRHRAEETGNVPFLREIRAKLVAWKRDRRSHVNARFPGCIPMLLLNVFISVGFCNPRGVFSFFFLFSFFFSLSLSLSLSHELIRDLDSSQRRGSGERRDTRVPGIRGMTKWSD